MSPNIRTSRKNITFDDKKIIKSNFYKNKKLVNIYDIDVTKILTSKKESSGKISYNGYNDDGFVRPLYIKLPQMIGYVKHFDSHKKICFKVNGHRLLKKYSKIWGKISSLMNIEFDSEPAYGDNDKYTKVKTKSYRDKVNTHFQDKKIPKENGLYRCLSLIVWDCYLSK